MKTNSRLHSPTFCYQALLLGLFICLLGVTNAIGQTIQSVNPNSTTAGQGITMVITGLNTNFTTVTGTWLRHSTQTSTVYQGINWTVNSPTNATVDFNIPPNAPLGNYRLESYGGFSIFNNALNVGVGQGSAYGYVSGKVIQDNNSNCIEDLGDLPYPNSIVSLLPGPYYLSTGPQGDYGGWIPLGNYTLTVSNVSNCGTWVCPSGGSQTANIPVSLSQDTGNDFYQQPGLCTDLGTSVSFLQPFRPGFDATQNVTYFNHGVTTATNVPATLVLPPQVTFVSAIPAPTSVVGNTLTWLYPSMAPGFVASNSVTVNVPVGTPLGTQITFTSSIPVVGNDPVLSNNTISCTFPVTGSFDPNDKQVWDQNGDPADGPVDPATQMLMYLIRFQNTGTDTAFNIFVRDTLDPYLDASTLRVTAASHPYQVSLTGQRNVQFTFPNIMLVDSFHNEPLSHGWIAYDIDLNPGVPVGTTISNDASIYFDFNSPVLTNTTQTTLCPLISAAYTANLAGNLATFTDQSGPGAISWAWDFGDGGTSTLQNPTHTYATNGTYNVCLSVSNSCRTDSTCDPLTIVGLKDALDLSVQVYPNPSNGLFTLKVQGGALGDLQWKVYDAKGSCLMGNSAQLGSGTLETSIDMSGYAAGLYFLQVGHDGKLSNLRLQKQ